MEVSGSRPRYSSAEYSSVELLPAEYSPAKHSPAEYSCAEYSSAEDPSEPFEESFLEFADGVLGFGEPDLDDPPVPFDPPPDPSSDPFFGATELLQRCLGGRQEEDWHRLVSLCESSLRGLLVRLLRQRWVSPTEDELDDLVQDLYLRLLRHRGKPFVGEGLGGFWSYLETLARNLLLDRWRYENATKRDFHEEPFGLLNNTDFDWQQRPWLASLLARKMADPSQPSPEQEVIRCSGRRHFLRCCLSSHRRTVLRCSVEHPYDGPGAEVEVRSLYLVFVEGWSSTEVSQALGGVLRAKQVDGLVARFRRFMAREGIDLPARRPRVVGVPWRLPIRKSRGGRKKKVRPSSPGRPGKGGKRERKGGRTKRG